MVLANRLNGPDFGYAVQVSGDAGRNWISIDPLPQLPEGADKCYAPEIAFDADGVLHYLFFGLAGQDNQPMGVFLTSSDDRAQTFTALRQVLGAISTVSSANWPPSPTRRLARTHSSPWTSSRDVTASPASSSRTGNACRAGHGQRVSCPVTLPGSAWGGSPMTWQVGCAWKGRQTPCRPCAGAHRDGLPPDCVPCPPRDANVPV